MYSLYFWKHIVRLSESLSVQQLIEAVKKRDRNEYWNLYWNSGCRNVYKYSQLASFRSLEEINLDCNEG